LSERTKVYCNNITDYIVNQKLYGIFYIHSQGKGWVVTIKITRTPFRESKISYDVTIINNSYNLVECDTFMIGGDFV